MVVPMVVRRRRCRCMVVPMYALLPLLHSLFSLLHALLPLLHSLLPLLHSLLPLPPLGPLQRKPKLFVSRLKKLLPEAVFCSAPCAPPCVPLCALPCSAADTAGEWSLALRTLPA